MQDEPANNPAQEHLERLRKDRSLPSPDLSLRFVADQFKRDVARPYQQLGNLAALWVELLPASLVERSRLMGLSRGVLHVEADNAAVHYELDRLLRGGLQKKLIQSHKGAALRKVSIKVAGGSNAGEVDPKRLPPEGDNNPKLDPSRQPARGRQRKAD